MGEWCSLAKQVNPEIEILVFVPPIYKESWDLAEPYIGAWRGEFEEILAEVKNDFSFEYLDLINHRLSKDRINWKDAEQLNYWGALNMTRYLEDNVFGR